MKNKVSRDFVICFVFHESFYRSNLTPKVCRGLALCTIKACRDLALCTIKVCRGLPLCTISSLDNLNNNAYES